MRKIKAIFLTVLFAASMLAGPSMMANDGEDDIPGPDAGDCTTTTSWHWVWTPLPLYVPITVTTCDQN